MTSCERCDAGTLSKQESGFFQCGSCGATVAPSNVRDPSNARILN